MIKEADNHLSELLERLKNTAEEDLLDPIQIAARGLVNAFMYPAILYGMRVAQAIQEVALDPNALSQHIMDRVAKSKEGRT